GNRFEGKHAFADAHLVDEAGEPSVVAPDAVPDRERLVPGNRTGHSLVTLDPRRRPVNEEAALPGTVVGESEMPPDPGLVACRLGVESPRVRSESQCYRHAALTALVGFAELPLVVRIIDVLFVEQVTAKFLLEF